MLMDKDRYVADPKILYSRKHPSEKKISRRLGQNILIDLRPIAAQGPAITVYYG